MGQSKHKRDIMKGTVAIRIFILIVIPAQAGIH
jgi:hypothetical protein